MMTAFPVIDLAGTGRRIERRRREAGLTVRDLQAYFGFEYPQAIYKWQHGECLPTVDNLLALARLLRVSMEDLLVYEDQGVSHFWFEMYGRIPKNSRAAAEIAFHRGPAPPGIMAHDGLRRDVCVRKNKDAVMGSAPAACAGDGRLRCCSQRRESPFMTENPDGLSHPKPV